MRNCCFHQFILQFSFVLFFTPDLRKSRRILKIEIWTVIQYLLFSHQFFLFLTLYSNEPHLPCLWGQNLTLFDWQTLSYYIEYIPAHSIQRNCFKHFYSFFFWECLLKEIDKIDSERINLSDWFGCVCLVFAKDSFRNAINQSGHIDKIIDKIIKHSIFR